ncbi:MAG TPA: DegT/DnrJ/EryC1/StrS family aminotransferase [Flavobacteriales bacterium]|nr:DegT/DnrJ/EryC1/StrS family aminotransferase [Flavobacteriales bacterium]
MINVTKSFLPDLEEYVKYLEGIWERGHLTNHGPLVLELESQIRQFLGVKHFFFVNNGTIALQIAIKAAGLSGDVITTPFSYVATTSCLVWENCKPVFADIDPLSLTVTAQTIEKVITPQTTGILITHVYGNPCPVEEIEALAKRKGLKVIYDAAHAFGVEYNNQSVLNYGDISTLSFHATKLFHTIEGGGIITNDDELAHKISYMRNFGHNGPEAFFGVGVNGKSSEFQAAMGLCLMPKINQIIESRKSLSDLYTSSLAGLPIQHLKIQAGTTKYNYAYYPIVFQTETDLLKVVKALNEKQIIPRRYFYPSLNTLNYVTNNLVDDYASEISKRVLCLPLYPDLASEHILTISDCIRSQIC